MTAKARLEECSRLPIKLPIKREEVGVGEKKYRGAEGGSIPRSTPSNEVYRRWPDRQLGSRVSTEPSS
ncbi:MAG: hypothetical protein ICV34_05200 [Rubrobacter sp.]|nr:hypothetical protein [Rubrobacter sp.]